MSDSQAPTDPGGFNPAQQDIIDRLAVPRGQRPGYDAQLRHDLKAELESGMAEAVAELGPDEQIFVSKSKLANVHGCEERSLHNDFEWSIPIARGRISHKAIELSMHWKSDPVPLDLVDEAVARLGNQDDNFGIWMQGLDEGDHAELRAVVGERVTMFLECFPPLRPQWRPGTEVSMRHELFSGKVVLQGKVDISLGRPDRLVAGKILIDLKTGTPRPVHFEDLRFYALVETLRLGTPPLRLASYYLDQATMHPEDVNEDVLYAAVGRTIDGVVKMIELDKATRAPRRSTSGLCRFCPVLGTCDDGNAYLASRDNPDDVSGHDNASS